MSKIIIILLFWLFLPLSLLIGFIIFLPYKISGTLEWYDYLASLKHFYLGIET